MSSLSPRRRGWRPRPSRPGPAAGADSATSGGHGGRDRRAGSAAGTAGTCWRWSSRSSRPAVRSANGWGAAPLWLDEETIALNLRDRTIADLAGALWLGQSAPLGWLAIVHAVIGALGTSEMALRLVRWSSAWPCSAPRSGSVDGGWDRSAASRWSGSARSAAGCRTIRSRSNTTRPTRSFRCSWPAWRSARSRRTRLRRAAPRGVVVGARGGGRMVRQRRDARDAGPGGRPGVRHLATRHGRVRPRCRGRSVGRRRDRLARVGRDPL